MHYVQHNITISPEQVEFVKTNFGKINNSELAKMLGLSYNKTHNNLRLLGLVTPRKDTGKVVKMDGYFDEEDFFKHYQY